MWYLYTLIAAMFYSASDIIKKKVLEKESTVELLLVIYGLLILFSLALPSSLHLSRQALFIIMLRSFFFGVAMHTITKAYHHLEISSVSPLMNLSPLFLLLLSHIFLPEKVSMLALGGIILTILGTYFLEVHSHYLDFKKHLKSFKNKYFIYVLLGLLAISGSALLTKKALLLTDKYTFFFYTNLFVFLYFFFVFLFGRYSLKRFWHDTKKEWLWDINIAILTFLFFFLYYSAVAYPGAKITLIIPLLRTSTLFTVAFGGHLFHDHYLNHKLFATLILLIGATLIIWG